MSQLGVSFVSFIHLFLDTCLKNNNICELCVNFFHDIKTDIIHLTF